MYENYVSVYKDNLLYGKIARNTTPNRWDNKWWITGQISHICKRSNHKLLRDAKLEIKYYANKHFGRE